MTKTFRHEGFGHFKKKITPKDLDDIANAVGHLAEHAALDLDHYGKNHKAWYRAVKKVRKLLWVQIS